MEYNLIFLSQALDKSAHYKELRDQAQTTIWVLYAVAALVLFITAGVGSPISLILFGIGQCYYGPKYSKYNKLYQGALSKSNQSDQAGKINFSNRVNETSTYQPQKKAPSQINIGTQKKRISPEDLI